MAKKRKAYHPSPKACPQPADYARFPELMAKVREEWRARMAYAKVRKWRKQSKDD